MTNGHGLFGGSARITMVSGHYGAGKSEFSVNFALRLAAESAASGTGGPPVVLADLDVVNPYFRSREARAVLESHGVRVIGNSLGIDAGVDLPAVSAAVMGPLRDTTVRTVIDLGGDPAGARVIRQFRPHIATEDTELLYVVNAFRPETRNAEAAIDSLRSIEAVIGMRFTALINNSHLLSETTVEHVVHGDRLCREIRELADLPVAWVSAVPAVLEQLPSEVAGTRLAINLHLRSQWMSQGNEHSPRQPQRAVRPPMRNT